MALCLGKVKIPKPSLLITPKNPSTFHPSHLSHNIKHPNIRTFLPNVPSLSNHHLHHPTTAAPTTTTTSPMPKQRFGPRNHTNPLIWCASIICAIIAVAVIITGVVVFVGYLTIKPKVPQVSVQRANLDLIYFDQSNVLTVQVTVVVKAENDNQKAYATFYDTNFALSFRGQKIAYLMAKPFDVKPNQSLELNYVSQSTPIPLNAEESEVVNLSLNRRVIDFELKGKTRTRWRVWLLGSLKFWLDLDCQLHLPTNLSTIYPPRCSSRSK